MNLNPTLRKPSTKTAILLVILALVLGGAAYYLHRFFAGAKPPWYVKWQIDRYLKRQSGARSFKTDFNFNLAAEVSKLQTELAQCQTNASLLSTNVAEWRKEMQALTRECSAIQQELTQLRHKTNNLSSDLASHRKSLAAKEAAYVAMTTNKVSSMTNFTFPSLTNQQAIAAAIAELKNKVEPFLATLEPLRQQRQNLSAQLAEKRQLLQSKQKEIAEMENQLATGKKTDAATNEVALTADEMGALSNKLAEAKTSLAALQTERDELAKQFNAADNEWDKQRHPIARSLSVLQALTNIIATRETVASESSNLVSVVAEYNRKAALLSEKQAALASKQKDIAEAQKKLDVLRSRIAEIRKTLLDKSDQLAAQQTDFTAIYKAKFEKATTYSQMYNLLGQMLYVAKKLLEEPDSQRKRMGMWACSQAANFALNYIENQWLAARICEAYLLPNLHLANDPAPKTPLNPANLLLQCGTIFQAAGERDNYFLAMEMSIKKATSPSTKDYACYYLGREYEQAGRYDDALRIFRSMNNTNNYSYVVRRLPALERIAQLKTQKKN